MGAYRAHAAVLARVALAAIPTVVVLQMATCPTAPRAGLHSRPRLFISVLGAAVGVPCEVRTAQEVLAVHRGPARVIFARALRD